MYLGVMKTLLLFLGDGGTILILLLTIAGILLYFLPALIGASKRNSTAIFWLNLLLGWSLIGWVVALVWALTNDPEQVAMVYEGSIETPTTQAAAETEVVG